MNGLSASQVKAQEKAGNTNKNSNFTSRTYFSIIKENVFNVINIILFSITAILVSVGRVSDAFIYIIVVLFNVAIGVIQEIVAKNKLDKIALLTRPRVLVIRDGVEVEILQQNVVLNDLLVLKPGDQAVVDGVVTAGKGMCDESLLTGESAPIAKQEKDEILSGSFIVSGTVYYTATKVGAESYANKLTTEARAFRKYLTPLQQEIQKSIQILLIIIGIFALVTYIQNSINGIPFTSTLQVLALIFGLIPNSLFAMITLAYSLGAVRIASKQALVQQLNAVESLSNVNTICLDKTGTLTTNKLEFVSIFPVNYKQKQSYSYIELIQLLHNYTAGIATPNNTSNAVLDGAKKLLAEQTLATKLHSVLAEIEFSSARKISAQLVSYEKLDEGGVYVLGAPEMMTDMCTSFLPEIVEEMKNGQKNGLRVLLFAHKKSISVTEKTAFLEKQHCPTNCMPLALVFLKDELRSDVSATLNHFQDLDIQVKIISGDNPQTVQSLVRQLHIKVDDDSVISGVDLENMPEKQWPEIIQKTTVFGRITPQQKEKIVTILKESGRYVAMVGDGVNDILSIKRAHVGIAMQNGSAATRAVADIILLNNSFSSLPFGFGEGQKIVSGLHTVTKLFLSRVLFMICIIVGVWALSLPFAFSIKQGSLISLLTTGIPCIALTLWAKPQVFLHGKSLFSSIKFFSIPAGLSVFPFAILLYQFFINTLTFSQAQTGITYFIIFCGLCLVAFSLPFHKGFMFHQYTYVDKKPAILALVMGFLFAACMFIPQIRTFWELTELSLTSLLVIFATGVLWLTTILFVWKKQS